MAINDPLRRAVASGHLTFCEEVARDGAQAKTLLDADQRIEIARRYSAILGEAAFGRLVFAAGFPAIGRREFGIVRRMALEIECCQLMAVCGPTRRGIENAIQSLSGARCGRIFVVAPTSEAISHCLVQRSAAGSVDHTQDLISFARDLGTPIHIDIALVDAPRADPSLVADAACRFTEAGGGAMVLCDTVGSCTPLQAARLGAAVLAGCGPEVLLGIHMHNDLGFGLASTLAVIREGFRYMSSSLLGLAERSGMMATEQMLVALASEPDAIEERYGIRAPVWPQPPALGDLVPLAKDIAGWLDIPLKVTDPVIGTGVNSISTGTPFRDPPRFMPYDAESLLGVPQRIVVTQLASRRVIREAAAQRDVTLAPGQVDLLTRWVKESCYERNQAVVPDDEFAELLQRVTSGGATDWASLERAEFVPASSLPQTTALPMDIMATAAAALPDALARFDGDQLMLSQAAAQAYLRVVRTDFSREAWHMDRPEDRDTLAHWIGLGGSFIADFGADPAKPRIFGWVLSPVPQAAQHALKVLKGRDGRWIPTSLVMLVDDLLSWVDSDRSAISREAVDRVLGLGPVGLRFAARPGVIPSYFLHRGLGGAFVQGIMPGRSSVWSAWLEHATEVTGHRFFGATSANFSLRPRNVRSRGTHKDLEQTQADMGFLGIPIASGPIEIDGQLLAQEDRAAGYKQLNRPFLQMTPEERATSTAMVPISTSLLGITADPGRWELLRHGSLHETVVRTELEALGIQLQPCEDERLELSHYVGDLLSRFSLFSQLEARHIAEISQIVETQYFEAGEVLVRAGDVADRMYFVVRGTVAVEIEPRVELGEGNFFGEIALIEQRPRTATVRGAADGLLLVLTTHALHRLMEDVPALGDSIRQRSRERLQHLAP